MNDTDENFTTFNFDLMFTCIFILFTVKGSLQWTERDYL